MLISTVDKLMRQIWSGESCGKYVGLVEYRPVENMRKEDFFQSEFKSSCHLFNEVGMAQTFLFKPDYLSYEKEVRFIARKPAEPSQQKERTHLMVDMTDKPYGGWTIEFRDRQSIWRSIIKPSSTKTLAQEAYNEIVRNVQRGLFDLPILHRMPGITVESYAKKYLEHIKAIVPENTFVNRQTAVNAIISI